MHWFTSRLTDVTSLHKRFKSTPETLIEIILICYCSVTQSCPTLCDPMDCSTPGFPVHRQLWELAQSHVHRVGDAIQPSRLLLPLLLLPSVFSVFSNELAIRIKGPQYWSFCFSLSPSNKYSGLISFRMDWLYLCCPKHSQESSPALQEKNLVFVREIVPRRGQALNLGVFQMPHDMFP